MPNNLGPRQAARSPTRSYQPRLSRSVLDVATSIVPYLALSALLDLTLGVSVLLTVSLVVLAAGFLVRTFVVFHDCAHGSLFDPSVPIGGSDGWRGCWCSHRLNGGATTMPSITAPQAISSVVASEISSR